MDRVILHCDCNSFFASVESIDHPEYRKVPMAVAGDPSQRHGIILAKNELAKKYHIQTAETIWQARRKCPGLLIIGPHYEKYESVSRRINEIYGQYTDMVEPFSVDESWLDVTASQNLFGSGVQIADALRQQISRQIGVTISVGVSYNKTFAKMGSDYKKPDATTVISRDNYKQILWPLPIEEMMFVGKSLAAVLRQHGYLTIGNAAMATRKQLIDLLGKGGGSIWDACNGLDDSPVALQGSYSAAKSISNNQTFDHDLTDSEEVRIGLLRLTDNVSKRLRQSGMYAGVIAVAVKDNMLQVRQKQQKISQPTCSTKVIYDTAWQLVGKIWHPGQPVRLLSVAVSGLTEDNDYQQDLFSDPHTQIRDNELDETIDAIRQRYGDKSIGFARLKENGKDRNDD